MSASCESPNSGCRSNHRATQAHVPRTTSPHLRARYPNRAGRGQALARASRRASHMGGQSTTLLRLLTVALVCWLGMAAPAWAEIAIVANTVKSPGGGNGTTSAEIDTTGATNIVVAISYYYLGSSIAVSDSKANDWTALTARTASNEAAVQLYYCTECTVGTGHTFTLSCSSCFGTVAVLAWSGGGAYDNKESGASNAATSTIQPGSLTPSENGAIVVTAVAFNTGSATLTIDSPFEKISAGYADYAGSTSEGLGLAYDIQTTATAANPTWTAAGSIDMNTAMAVFLAGEGGEEPSASPAASRLLLTGAGQ